jgi:hypothetical protein
MVVTGGSTLSTVMDNVLGVASPDGSEAKE